MSRANCPHNHERVCPAPAQVQVALRKIDVLETDFAKLQAAIREIRELVRTHGEALGNELAHMAASINVAHQHINGLHSAVEKVDQLFRRGKKR
jgi:hypothetical protein